VTARLGACLLASVLAGCATAPPALVAPPPAGSVLPETWAASGRMAVSVAAEGGSGAFTWQQSGERTQVAVRGPLGVGAVDVTLEGDRLTVVDGEGVTLEGDAARAHVQSKLGAELPLASLRYWVNGLPDPGAAATVHDGGGPPVRVIEQAGWRVAYEAFGRFDGQSRPTRLTATGANARLKLVLDRWTVGQADRPSSP
jgi:outer membrane lipoprotein LolB